MSKRLTPKQQQFAKNFLDPESETFSNGVRSAIKAGYSENYGSSAQRADRLKKGKLGEMMEENKEEFKLDIGKHVQALDEMVNSLIDKAKAKGGLTIGELEKLVKPIRFFAEYAGKVGSGNQVNIAILQQEWKNGSNRPCPTCGYSPMGMLRLDEIMKDLPTLKPVINTQSQVEYEKTLDPQATLDQAMSSEKDV